MEVADRELERMVERRSRNGEVDPDEQEELWKASVQRYNSQRAQENRAAWCEHHRLMQSIHEGLARNHELHAKRLQRGEA